MSTNRLLVIGAAAACAALLWAMPASLSAQWIHYPTAGVPRTPSGAPNLNARAPRAYYGKPDFNGMWELKSKPSGCPELIRLENGECIEKDALSNLTRNIGEGVPGGLPYQPWAAELMKKRAATAGMEDPHTKCLPPNFPRAFTMPHIMKFVQTPGLLVILDEYNAAYRQIFTDGRPLPEDPQPSWNGYSTGHWEGDTLVVNTIGFRDDLWLDMAGNPMTSAAKVNERFRRPNYGTLEVTVTVDDKKAYTKPWTVKMNLSIVLDTEMMDEICLENEKSMQHMPGK